MKVSKQGVIPTQATAWPVADHQLHNMKVQRKKRFGDSDLAKTLLRINPAVDKKVKGTLDILTKTQFKDRRFSENKQRQFFVQFEERRRKRQILYERLRPKLDEEVRLGKVFKYVKGKKCCIPLIGFDVYLLVVWESLSIPNNLYCIPH